MTGGNVFEFMESVLYVYEICFQSAQRLDKHSVKIHVATGCYPIRHQHPQTTPIKAGFSIAHAW